MDEQTLQYMGERVDKAREIKNKIRDLEDLIKYSDEKQDVQITSNGRGCVEIKSLTFRALAARTKAAVLNEVLEEIKLLKQELAEL
ncbi:hypothetical protein D3C74_160000 [compost metagenome]